MHSLETHFRFWILIFLWGRDMWVGPLFWCWAVEVSSNQEKTATMLTAILFFTFSTAFNKLHEIFNSSLLHRLPVKGFCPTKCWCSVLRGFRGVSDGKEYACNEGDLGLIPGLGRSTGEGNGNPLQYSCLGNPMDRGAGKLQSVGSQRVEHNWATNKHAHTHKHSVLSMFKVGKPMLWYRFISLNAFSAYEGFIKRWCHHKLRWICMCIHTCLCINVLVNFFSQSVCVDIYIFTDPYLPFTWSFGICIVTDIEHLFGQ